MEEEEVRSALLDGDDDRLLQLENKLAEVGGEQGAAVMPAQEEARRRRLGAYVIAQVGTLRLVAREGFVVLPERARGRGLVADDLDGLANDAEAEARVCQPSHRASVTGLGLAPWVAWVLGSLGVLGILGGARLGELRRGAERQNHWSDVHRLLDEIASRASDMRASIGQCHREFSGW